MGSEHMVPGKSNAQQVATTSSPDNEMVPGKTTRVDHLFGPGSQTGNAGVDNAGKGTETGRGDNFLNDQQRPVLIAEYIGRVNAAHAAYLSALSDLHVERVTEKEEEFPIVASLLLAAGGRAAEVVIGSACRLLRHNGESIRQLAEAGIHEVKANVAESPMLGLSEKSVEFLISTATDQAKDKFKAKTAGALGAEQQTTKGQALSFVDYMRDASMTLFQRFREEPIGRASDAQLLALYASFDGSRHTPTLYRIAADDYLKKYMRSHAKDIGHKYEFGAKDGKMAEWRTEVRVAKIKVGSTTRLGYVQNEYVGGERGVLGDEATDASEHAVGLDEAGVENDGPKFIGFVEPELVDVATATHDQRWLQTPQSYTLNLPSMTLTKEKP